MSDGTFSLESSLDSQQGNSIEIKGPDGITSFFDRIELIEGANVNINVNPVANSIEFASTGGGGGVTRNGNFNTLPDFLDFYTATSLRTGQTADGMFFSGNAPTGAESYPVRTNFKIDGTSKVEVLIDMTFNESCGDFSICVFEDGGAPEWQWDSNDTRIAIAYDCGQPYINGLSNTQGASFGLMDEGYGTYRVKFTYDPLNTPNIQLDTLDTYNKVLNTITIDETLNLSNFYRIGFAADQDNEDKRSFVKNLKITVSGNDIYQDSLCNGVSEYSGWLVDQWFGPEVYFKKSNYGEEVDYIDNMLSITRGNNSGIYNPQVQENYSGGGPSNTEWNIDGWDDLSDITTRTYTSWNSAHNGWAGYITGMEFVMHDTYNDKYYAIKFTMWQPNNQGGAFAYVRRQINPSVFFRKFDGQSIGDNIAPGLTITRDNNGGIYNSQEEGSWDGDVSPVGTEWNTDGWADLSNVKSRQYLTFFSTFVQNYLGKQIVGQELVMHDTINDEYWAIKFTHWTPNNNGGGFAYIRKKIDTIYNNVGVKFGDGTIQKTAYLPEKQGILPQNKLKAESNYDYYLSPYDIGKHVLVSQSGQYLFIPNTSLQQFPLGSMITIVNVSGGSIYIVSQSDFDPDTIYGAGTADSGTSWEIPDLGGYNVVTLIKIDHGWSPNNNFSAKWILSGPGIALN